VETGDADVFEDASVVIEVLMEEAGDQVTRAGRTRSDDGNQYIVTIEVNARHYERPS
jgi:hypothetical protein